MWGELWNAFVHTIQPSLGSDASSTLYNVLCRRQWNLVYLRICVCVYLCVCVFGPLLNCLFCVVMYLQCMPPLDLSSWAAADNGIRRYCASPPSLLCLSALPLVQPQCKAVETRNAVLQWEKCRENGPTQSLPPPPPTILGGLFCQSLTWITRS